MLKIVSLIPLLAATVAVLAFIGTTSLILYGHPWWGLLTSFITTIFGVIAYTGFRVQRKVDAVTDTAIETVGKHAERVADAVVERVKKT